MGWELQGIFGVLVALRDLGQIKTHLENNWCRPFLENGVCGAHRLCIHFFAKSILQPPLSVGLSDEPWTDGPFKGRAGSSGVNPPPLSTFKCNSTVVSEVLCSWTHKTSYPVQGVQEFTYKEQRTNKTGLYFLFKSKIIRADGEQRDRLWLIKGWDCRAATDVILLYSEEFIANSGEYCAWWTGYFQVMI